MTEDIDVKNEAVIRSRTSKLNEYLSTSQNKSYFVGAISIIFIGVFVVFGIVPAIRSVLSQNEENKIVDTELQKLNKKKAVIDSLVKEVDSKGEVLGLFESIFPDQNSQETVIKDVYEIATNNNVFIKTSNFPKGRREVALAREFRTKEQVASQKINLNVEGSRQELLEFIRQLEQSKRIYNAVSVVITKKTGEALRNAQQGREYDLSLVIEYFYWNEDRGKV